jgi:hypothetical protein
MGLAIGFLKLVRTVQYRNPDTGEIKARENRSEGVCIDCAKEIMQRQQERQMMKKLV